MYILLVVFAIFDTRNMLQVWELHAKESGAAATVSQWSLPKGVQQDMSHPEPLTHAEHKSETSYYSKIFANIQLYM